MKTKIAGLILSMMFSAQAQKFEDVPAPKPSTPSSKSVTNVPAQKPLSLRPVASSSQERSQQVIDKFRQAYPKLGEPRIMISVNRYSAGDSAKASASQPATTPDIEQLVARTLRSGGATLADQKAVNELMPGKILKASTKDEDLKASHDRDSLRKIADVAIEVVISSHTIAGKEGEKPETVPDVQASAIRLEDGQIIGQAASANLKGQVRELNLSNASEAIAISLMEDMVREAK